MSSVRGAGPVDWYTILGLGPDATTEQIVAAVERLARHANALAITAPERARLLRDQVRAVKQDLLSGPESRQRYDQGLATRGAGSPPPGQEQRPQPASGPTPAPVPGPYPAAPGHAIRGAPVGPSAPGSQSPGSQSPGSGAPGLMSRISKFLQTGWTCVGCGYGAQPTDKFCPKCGSRIESGLGGQTPGAWRPGQAGGGSPSQVPQAQAARCGNCGSLAAPGDTFCMRCGTGLSSDISGN